jgi:hypothetical protein
MIWSKGRVVSLINMCRTYTATDSSYLLRVNTETSKTEPPSPIIRLQLPRPIGKDNLQ